MAVVNWIERAADDADARPEAFEGSYERLMVMLDHRLRDLPQKHRSAEKLEWNVDISEVIHNTVTLHGIHALDELLDTHSELLLCTIAPQCHLL